MKQINWKALLEKGLRKVGLELHSRTEERLQNMRKHHTWQQNNLKSANECEYERIERYILDNKMLRVQRYFERCKCGEQLAYTVRIDTDMFLGLHPGDRHMEEMLEHAMHRACMELIHHGSLKREAVPGTETFVR